MSQEVSTEGRWRLWTAEETARKAVIQGWVENTDPAFSYQEKKAWQTLSDAGVALGERWQPFLAQTSDFMKAWVGVLEDQQENIAYLWAHMGRPGQSAEDVVAEGLVPLSEPLRFFGRKADASGKWLFARPLSQSQATLGMQKDVLALTRSLFAISQAANPPHFFTAAQAAWERAELQKQVRDAHPQHESPAFLAPHIAPKRI